MIILLNVKARSMYLCNSHILYLVYKVIKLMMFPIFFGSRRGCDRIVVGFITTYAFSAYHY